MEEQHNDAAQEQFTGEVIERSAVSVFDQSRTFEYRNLHASGRLWRAEAGTPQADSPSTKPAPGCSRPSSEEFQTLMSAVANGDRAAFARLFKHFAPRVKGYLVRSGTQNAVAEDVAQETMVTVWRSAASFHPDRGSLPTWIFTIARNLCVDHYRRGTAASACVDIQPWDDQLEVADSRPGPDDLLLAVQRQGRVHRAFLQLAPDQAALLRLSFFEERPYAAIARELGVPISTVKSRMRAAIARMRNLLQIA